MNASNPVPEPETLWLALAGLSAWLCLAANAAATERHFLLGELYTHPHSRK